MYGYFEVCDFKRRHTWKVEMNLNSGLKNSPLCQIWAWSNNYLPFKKIIQVSLFFHPKKWSQRSLKVAIPTSDYNGYWQNMQNNCQICRFKIKRFLFNILWRFGAMEEKPCGGGGGWGVRIKWNRISKIIQNVMFKLSPLALKCQWRENFYCLVRKSFKVMKFTFLDISSSSRAIKV